jgi:phosphoglycerol transferase
MTVMDQGAERPRWAIDTLATALATAALLVFALMLWRHDLSVPFNYWGDTLHFAALTQALMLNGWPHHVPQLGAPFGFEAVAFPSLMSTDWALTWLIARFVDTPGAALNLFWLLSIVLTALSARVALRLLGASRYIAIAAAVLYALLPGTFIRNTAHISLVYYTVPLLAAFCISLLSRDDRDRQARALFRWAVVAAVLQGFNYIYFTFFAAAVLLLCLLWLTASTGLGVLTRRAGIALTLLLVSGAINLLPALISWHAEGQPPVMDYKFAAEAEIGALKLRKALLPHEDNAVLGVWARMDRAARFPNENENEAVRLGPFGAVALLTSFLLLCALAMGRAGFVGQNARSAAVLVSMTFLAITVGGLGTIFNVLVAPDIRAHNRFSVFLAFFAFVVFSLLVTEAARSVRRGYPRALLLTITTVLCVFSAYDQLLEAGTLRSRYKQDQLAAAHEQAAVRSLETALEPGAMIFQFPITSFPPDGWRLGMGPYDHARPFLWSSQLRWSWPTFSGRKHMWEQELESSPRSEWGERLVLSGFDAVWIDRDGLADRGAAFEAALVAAGATGVVSTGPARYGLLDLRPVLRRLKAQAGEAAIEQAMARALPEMSIEYRSGFYPAERTADGREFRWMQREAALNFRNHSAEAVNAVFTLALQSGGPGQVVVEVDGRRMGLAQASTVGEESRFELRLEPRKVAKLRLISQHAPLNAPNDPRALYTTLLSLQLRPSTPALQAPAK